MIIQFLKKRSNHSNFIHYYQNTHCTPRSLPSLENVSELASEDKSNECNPRSLPASEDKSNECNPRSLPASEDKSNECNPRSLPSLENVSELVSEDRSNECAPQSLPSLENSSDILIILGHGYETDYSRAKCLLIFGLPLYRQSEYSRVMG